MEFGAILLPTHNGHGVIARARRAVELGFSRIGVGDVPGRDGELYVTLGVLAANGLDARLGPMVTNPVSRHPDVTAAAIHALEGLHPAGVFLGLGRGGSPLNAMGLSRPTTDVVAATAARIRSSLDRLESVAPVLVSAYGPRTLKKAAAVSDGVIVAGGASVEYVTRAIDSARGAVVAAGRSLDSLEISLMLRISVAESRVEAIRAIRGNLASAGANNLRAETDLAQLSDVMRAKVTELRRRYDTTSAAHMTDGSPNANLIDELGLTEMLAERYALAGTPEQVRARLQQYEQLGVAAVWAPAVESDPDGFLERLGSALPRN
jgi:5,10-methylenetetrahydromethanopterin reductase